MPASFRDRLADVYAHTISGADGIVGSTYTRQASAESAIGGMYWCRGEPVSATESPMAGQQQHTIDIVFLFGVDAEGVLSTDGVVYYEGRFYKVNGITPPTRLTNEIEVTATFISDEVYDSIVGGP